jgi:hypothetical protein
MSAVVPQQALTASTACKLAHVKEGHARGTVVVTVGRG